MPLRAAAIVTPYPITPVQQAIAALLLEALRAHAWPQPAEFDLELQVIREAVPTIKLRGVRPVLSMLDEAILCMDWTVFPYSDPGCIEAALASVIHWYHYGLV